MKRPLNFYRKQDDDHSRRRKVVIHLIRHEDCGLCKRRNSALFRDWRLLWLTNYQGCADIKPIAGIFPSNAANKEIAAAIVWSWQILAKSTVEAIRSMENAVRVSIILALDQQRLAYPNPLAAILDQPPRVDLLLHRRHHGYFARRFATMATKTRMRAS